MSLFLENTTEEKTNSNGGVVQLVECLLGMHKAPWLIFTTALKQTWCVLGIPTFCRWRQEDQSFKAILSYTASSRPLWTTVDPAWNKQKLDNKKEDIHWVRVGVQLSRRMLASKHKDLGSVPSTIRQREKATRKSKEMNPEWESMVIQRSNSSLKVLSECHGTCRRTTGFCVLCFCFCFCF